MNSKTFLQRFNRELATLGFPEEQLERIKAVSKVFGISRHLANSLIMGGHVLPNADQLDMIARTLEICPRWLSGASERRKVYPEQETVESV